MNAFTLAWRFLHWRAVATWLAILSIALAVGMVVALRSLPGAIGAGTVEPAVRFPVLVGRGESASRLVLAVVFLEPPATPSLPPSLLAKVTASPGVAEAFPLRIEHGHGLLVGTSRAYFRLAQGRLGLASGRFFEDTESGVAVAGSTIAKNEKLVLGTDVSRGEARAKIVGILDPTGTTVDDAVFVPLRPADASVSAIVVVPGDGFDPDTVARALADPSTLVVPVEPTLRKLAGLVTAVERIVGWLSGAIAALTVALVVSSFYSSVRERIRDLGVLRVLGARPSTVMLVLGCEAAIVGGTGSALGLLVGEALLYAARSALAAAGFAFAPHVDDGALRVAGTGALVAAAAGLAVSLSAYRMDPVRALAGVHRPWAEVLGRKGEANVRRFVLASLVAFAIGLPTAMQMPSTPGRLPDDASMRLFDLLGQWDGEDTPPPEIAALDGKTIAVEGYQYVPFEPGPTPWRSHFFVVVDNPSHPVELFHEDSEHRPGVSQRIAVDLSEPVETTRYPVRVTGTFVVRPQRSALGPAVYQLAGARAKVVAFEGD